MSLFLCWNLFWVSIITQPCNGLLVLFVDFIFWDSLWPNFSQIFYFAFDYISYFYHLVAYCNLFWNSGYYNGLGCHTNYYMLICRKISRVFYHVMRLLAKFTTSVAFYLSLRIDSTLVKITLVTWTLNIIFCIGILSSRLIRIFIQIIFLWNF